MPTRSTRAAFLPALLLSTAVALTACGSSSSSSNATLGADAVHVSGDVGTSAAVDFDGQITDQSTQTKTLVTGTGPEIAEGDSVVLHSVLADGFTQKTIQNDYENKQPATLVTISSQLPALIHDAIVGKTLGSRVMIYTPAEKLYGGAPDPSSGIGNKDAVVVLLDLVDKTLDGPNGAAKPSPSWAPKVVESQGVVSGLDFAGTPKPDGKLHVGVLQEGTGKTVEKGQLLGVNYLGSVYQGTKPFDESYSKDPVGFPIGVGQVIPGWDKALVGQKVGSRVILEIPPSDGYADTAKPGIPKNSTLYFVVDILSAT